MHKPNTEGVLILLGNENDENENLNEIAEERVAVAVELLSGDYADWDVLPTGGFGHHFNVSNTPHGQLITRALETKGIASERIWPHTDTSGTISDAYAARRRIDQHGSIHRVCVVTSEFHMARAKYIFSRVFSHVDLSFRCAPNPASFSNVDLERVVASESKKLENTRSYAHDMWVESPNFDLEMEDVISARESLAQELRHYDRYSYLALFAAFASVGFTVSLEKEVNSLQSSILVHLITLGIVVLAGYLYLRLADTASIFRRSMNALEEIYRCPGLKTARRGTAVSKGPGVRVTVAVFILLLVVITVVHAFSPFV